VSWEEEFWSKGWWGTLITDWQSWSCSITSNT